MKNLIKMISVFGLLLIATIASSANYAIIIDGKVKKVFSDNGDPAVIARNTATVTIPDGVICKVGYIYVNGLFVPPENKFTKLQIRRGMRAINQEAALDALLQNPTFAKDWNDAIEINLSDSLTQQALASLSVDVNAVKIAIANLE